MNARSFMKTASCLGARRPIAQALASAMLWLPLGVALAQTDAMPPRFTPLAPGNDPARGPGATALPAPTTALPLAAHWRATSLADSGQLVLEAARDQVSADGRSVVLLTLRLFDRDGQKVTSPTDVVVSTNRGRVRLPGAAIDEPPRQTLRVNVRDGEATVELVASYEPGDADLQVQSGNVVVHGRIGMVTERRPMIAVGVVEGTLNLSRLDASQISPAREDDGFELEMRRHTNSFDNGKGSLGARTAFFLKGVVKGETLLTLAYDSEKESGGRLFRDIQPDQYYPIYGDSSLRGFDAQSRQRLYVRVDQGRSFVLYGDFNTGTGGPARELSRMNRSVSGLQMHHEGETFEANAWVVRDNVAQVVDEQPSRGVSGPYRLSSSDGISGSEKVEILTRDRNQPSIILRAEPMVRFVDYEFEPFAGSIVFRAPVPSVDANLNPMSVRVTYEVEQGGPKYWLGGVDGNWRITPALEIGGSHVESQDPSDPYKLSGVNATLRLGDQSWALVELARSERDALGDRGQGDGARLEVRHQGERLDARLWAGETDREFSNISSSYNGGRAEAGAVATWKMDEEWSLRVDAMRSEDKTVDAVRETAYAGVQYKLSPKWTVGVGLRHGRDEGGVPNAASASGINIPQTSGFTPFQINAPLFSATPGQTRTFNALSINAQGQLTDRLTVLGEFEQDVENVRGQRVTVGADYRLSEQFRAYGRAEVAKGLGGVNGIAVDGRETALVAGLSSETIRDGEVFNEYRLRDAISGEDAVNAIGLRQTFRVSEGVRYSASIEHQKAIAGDATSATALTGGIDLAYDPTWRATGRLEWRRDRNHDAWLSTLGTTVKIDRDWSFLTRNTLSLQNARHTGAYDQWQDRFQIGAAYRQTDLNRVNALGLYELRAENDENPGIDYRRTSHAVSLHADYHPSRPWWLTGRLAGKHVSERFLGGVRSNYVAYLAGGRITWDLSERWDLGLQHHLMWSPQGDSRQDSFGVEAGYLIKSNLWLSFGVNLRGFRDDELTGAAYTRKGVYLRLRFKFDETLFRGADPGTNRALSPLASAARP
jgi:predicted porin